MPCNPRQSYYLARSKLECCVSTSCLAEKSTQQDSLHCAASHPDRRVHEPRALWVSPRTTLCQSCAFSQSFDRASYWSSHSCISDMALFRMASLKNGTLSPVMHWAPNVGHARAHRLDGSLTNRSPQRSCYIPKYLANAYDDICAK